MSDEQVTPGELHENCNTPAGQVRRDELDADLAVKPLVEDRGMSVMQLRYFAGITNTALDIHDASGDGPS